MQFLRVLGLVLLVGFGCEQTRTETYVQMCMLDSECPDGTVCHPVDGACVECYSDSQCAGSRCDTQRGECVECLEGVDCSTGVCAVSVHRCVECMKSSDCAEGVCSKSTFECVECVSDSDCPVSDSCHFAGCFESTCEVAELPDLSPCSDGDQCTLGDRCYAGLCEAAERDPACEPDLDYDGVTTGQGDCADDDPTVYPGAEEVCDQKDNDCDGVTDGDECTWSGCFRTGCLGQVCADHDVDVVCEFRPEFACLKLTKCGPFGPGGRCEFQPTPAYLACFKDLCRSTDELCDALDNDCDGAIDEKGVCQLGTCTDECDCYEKLGDGFVKPCAERCESCGSFWQCVNGQCMEACGPVPDIQCDDCGEELCGNDQDDDCDGEVDEGCVCAGLGSFVESDASTPCCEGLVAIGKCSSQGVMGAPGLETGYYCTACGDGVCDAPESACNCASDCGNETPDCMSEGEVGTTQTQFAPACCPGLVAVAASYAKSEGSGVVCESPASGAFTCVRCGDGVCGMGENGCRCPQDCELESCAVPSEYLWVELPGLLSEVTNWLGAQVATWGVVTMGTKTCTALPCPEMVGCCNTCFAPLLLQGVDGVPLPLLTGDMDLPGCFGNECDEVLECSPLPVDSVVVVYGLLIGPAPLGLAVTGFCLEPSAEMSGDPGSWPNGAMQ